MLIKAKELAAKKDVEALRDLSDTEVCWGGKRKKEKKALDSLKHVIFPL